MPGDLAHLLLLADGRFPAGGHAHSGGLEPLAATGRVRDVPTLEAFLRGRAATGGAVSAAFAAAASLATRFGELDAELDARLPSAAVRSASRTLGRQLLRTARAVWPAPAWDGLGAAPHQPIVLGAVCAAASLDPHAAAHAALHEAVTGPATAAVRLLGLDPHAVHAALARLGPLLDDLATTAAGHARTAPADLPALSAPLLDIAAEHHATWEVRLFAS
ncbi:urease accessory protein UreF [Actinomadura chokoriensis]|uniref:urease accessory protein UreF n=1 Tax=Actinomadura chokoriensis TaxID=454156 RepID=UPI0031F95172